MMLEEHGEPLTEAGNGLLKHGVHETEEEKRKRRRELTLAVISGQVLAFIIAVMAVLTKVLYDVHSVSSPALQNTCGYGLTFLLFLYPCGGPRKVFTEDKKTVFALFLVSLADSQAAFFDNLAYSFNVSIASVGMLSSFTIPCVMILSYCFLKVRYRYKHFIGVAIALLGLVCVVAADVLGIQGGSDSPSTPTGNATDNSTSPDQGGDGSAVIGDFLILVGCIFYAVSNVSTEAFVKAGSLFQYLVWLGFFSSLISLIQWAVLEGPQAVANVAHPGVVFILFILYGGTFALIYFGCGLFLARFDSVVMNLSFLTTDVWGLIFGYFIFSEEVHALKFVGFVAIVAGVVVYNMEAPVRLTGPGSGKHSQQRGIGEMEEDDDDVEGNENHRVLRNDEDDVVPLQEMQVIDSSNGFVHADDQRLG